MIARRVAWQIVQHLGGFYVGKAARHRTALYGVFALVLGLLACSISAPSYVLAAEINVVRGPAMAAQLLLQPACSRPTGAR